MFTNKVLNIKQLLSIMIVVLISVFVLASCDEAKEAMDDTTEAVGNAADKAGEVAGDAVDKVGDAAKDVTNKAGEVASDAVDKAGEVAGDAVDKVADVISNNKMVGVWTGKLDIRTATLEITKQNGLEFEGKIVVNFKNTINQEIKGSLNAETMEVKMIDQLRSKRKGIYVGKLDEEGLVISGIFKTNNGDKKYNFKLTKK